MSIVKPAQSSPSPKLSVCLPTYNRAELLREALEAIANQGDLALSESIEVLVSDNASADNTSAVVREIMDQYPALRIHYVRHSENIGMDRNLYGVVQRAVGEFILIVSDDDILLPGALATLLEAMSAYPDLDAICLNMRTFQTDTREISPAVLSLDKDTRLSDGDACLTLFGTWITFLSIVAFRRSAMRKEGYEERIGTYFVLSYLFLDVLNHGALVLCHPLIAVRDNYIGGYNFFEVFVTRFQEMMNYAREKHYSPQVTEKVFRQHLRKFLFPFLRAYKRRSAAEKPLLNYCEGAVRMLRAYGADPFLLFVMLPLLFAPPVLLRAAYEVRQSLRSVKP